MSLLNTEELKRQIANGTFTGLSDIKKRGVDDVLIFPFLLKVP